MQPPPMTATEPHPKIRRMIAHWESLAPGPGILPGRQHFDPIQVPDLLPHIWLIDVERGPMLRFRYRLLGTALIVGTIVEVLGRAPLGDPLRIRVGDTSLSLRMEEAALIQVAPALT